MCIIGMLESTVYSECDIELAASGDFNVFSGTCMFICQIQFFYIWFDLLRLQYIFLMGFSCMVSGFGYFLVNTCLGHDFVAAVYLAWL
jgi:hypothetical protein